MPESLCLLVSGNRRGLCFFLYTPRRDVILYAILSVYDDTIYVGDRHRPLPNGINTDMKKKSMLEDGEMAAGGPTSAAVAPGGVAPATAGVCTSNIGVGNGAGIAGSYGWIHPAYVGMGPLMRKLPGKKKKYARINGSLFENVICIADIPCCDIDDTTKAYAICNPYHSEFATDMLNADFSDECSKETPVIMIVKDGMRDSFISTRDGITYNADGDIIDDASDDYDFCFR